MTRVDQKIPIVIEVKEDTEFSIRHEAVEKKKNEEGMWTMYFYGSISREGVGSGIRIISPNRDFKVYSYKLTFECTNNVAKYEDFRLGSNALKYLKEKRIYVFGDYELVVN